MPHCSLLPCMRVLLSKVYVYGIMHTEHAFIFETLGSAQAHAARAAAASNHTAARAAAAADAGHAASFWSLLVLLPTRGALLSVVSLTKVVQGWPKLWANFIALIGIFSQSVGPSLAVWANPVHFSFFCAVVCWSHHAGMLHSIISENGARRDLAARPSRLRACRPRGRRGTPSSSTKVKFTGLTQNSQVDAAV
jgi:hypothetical protein